MKTFDLEVGKYLSTRSKILKKEKKLEKMQSLPHVFPSFKDLSLELIVVLQIAVLHIPQLSLLFRAGGEILN